MVRRTLGARAERAGNRFTFSVATAAALALGGAIGCSGDDSEEPEPRKPDTGYGAGNTAPDPRTCTDLCTRLSDCSANLCNEDTHSTRYDALEDLIFAECEVECSPSTVDSRITAQQWQCLFQSSCRQAIDYDTCGAGASYHCN